MRSPLSIVWFWKPNVGFSVSSTTFESLSICIAEQRQNFVSLQTELDFIKNYKLLLETRFHDALFIDVNVEKGIYERAIVPVRLQILIENALKHTITDQEKPLKIEILPGRLSSCE